MRTAGLILLAMIVGGAIVYVVLQKWEAFAESAAFRFGA